MSFRKQGNELLTLCTLITLKSLLSFQYYEMSYGLNIEMHKQVGTIMFPHLFQLGGFPPCQGMSDPGGAAHRL